MKLDLQNRVAPQVFESLRSDIISQRLRPGQRLSEKDVALKYGVSRTPAREAFIELRECGLVEIFPQRGTFVTKISHTQVKGAQFVREAIEVAVLNTLVKSPRKAFLEEQAVSIVQQKAAAADDNFELFLSLDEAFHRAFAIEIGCERAWIVTENENAQLDRVRFLNLSTFSPMDELIEQHTSILSALKNSNAGAVNKIIRLHLREVLKVMPKIAADYPQFFESEPDAVD